MVNADTCSKNNTSRKSVCVCVCVICAVAVLCEMQIDCASFFDKVQFYLCLPHGFQ